MLHWYLVCWAPRDTGLREGGICVVSEGEILSLSFKWRRHLEEKKRYEGGGKGSNRIAVGAVRCVH